MSNDNDNWDVADPDGDGGESYYDSYDSQEEAGRTEQQAWDED